MILRTFLASPLGGLFAQELKAYLPLLQKLIPNVKWVRPEQVHITLHFFGATLEDEIPEIKGLIQPIAAGYAPLRIRLKSVAFFPDANKARVLWLGILGDVEPLLRLQHQMEERLAQAGYPLEKRGFKPHATVGRSRASAMRVPSRLKLPEIVTPERILDHVVLYKSNLTPQGSFYEVLQTFPFSQKPSA